MRKKLSRNRKLYAGDVAAIYSEIHGKAVPFFLAENPSVFEILIELLFDFRLNGMDPQVREKAVYILAALSSNKHSTASVDEGVRTRLAGFIAQVSEVCQDKAFGIHILEHKETLVKYIDNSVVASGILYWIRISILDRSYYETSYHIQCNAVFLILMAEIAEKHPLQRDFIFTTIQEALRLPVDLEAHAIIQFHKQLFRFLIHLIHLGMVCPVFEYLIENVQMLDHALIRFFITVLIESISSPFSDEFILKLLEFLGASSAESAIRNNEQCLKTVRQFVSSSSLDTTRFPGASSWCD